MPSKPVKRTKKVAKKPAAKAAKRAVRKDPHAAHRRWLHNMELSVQMKARMATPRTQAVAAAVVQHAATNAQVHAAPKLTVRQQRFAAMMAQENDAELQQRQALHRQRGNLESEAKYVGWSRTQLLSRIEKIGALSPEEKQELNDNRRMQQTVNQLAPSAAPSPESSPAPRQAATAPVGQPVAMRVAEAVSQMTGGVPSVDYHTHARMLRSERLLGGMMQSLNSSIARQRAARSERIVGGMLRSVDRAPGSVLRNAVSRLADAAKHEAKVVGAAVRKAAAAMPLKKTRNEKEIRRKQWLTRHAKGNRP